MKIKTLLWTLPPLAGVSLASLIFLSGEHDPQSGHHLAQANKTTQAMNHTFTETKADRDTPSTYWPFQAPRRQASHSEASATLENEPQDTKEQTENDAHIALASPSTESLLPEEIGGEAVNDEAEALVFTQIERLETSGVIDELQSTQRPLGMAQIESQHDELLREIEQESEHSLEYGEQTLPEQQYLDDLPAEFRPDNEPLQ